MPLSDSHTIFVLSSDSSGVDDTTSEADDTVFYNSSTIGDSAVTRCAMLVHTILAAQVRLLVPVHTDVYSSLNLFPGTQAKGDIDRVEPELSPAQFLVLELQSSRMGSLLRPSFLCGPQTSLVGVTPPMSYLR